MRVGTLGRRTGDLLNASVLPGPDPVTGPLPDTGFRALFDGSVATFSRWRLAGPGGGGMLHVNGEMVSYGDGGLRLFYYATETFGVKALARHLAEHFDLPWEFLDAPTGL